MDANTIIPLVLGAGGVAFLGTVFNFVQAWRNSAESREAKAIGNLERWATDCQENLDHERNVSAYWQRRSALMEGELLRAGIQVPTCDPPPARPIGMT